MFGLLRATLRSFVVGVVIGVLFAPRPGAETRRMLSERFAAIVNQVLEIAALPPIEPQQARTNGHTDRAAPTKRARAGEGSSARASD